MCSTWELVPFSASQLLALFHKMNGTRRILHVAVFLIPFFLSGPMTYFCPSVTLRYSLSIRWIFSSAFALLYSFIIFFPISIFPHPFSAFLISISSIVYRISVVFPLTFSIFVFFILRFLFSYLLSEFFTIRRIFSSTSLRMNEPLCPAARLFSWV